MGRKNHGDILGARTLIFINLVFICAAIAIIVAAAISAHDLHDVKKKADVLKSLNMDVYLEIVLFCGALMFVTAIIGIISAIFRLKRLMVVYVLIIFCILAIQLAMGIVMVIMNKNNVHSSYREDSLSGAQRRSDFEVYAHCCGWSYITEEFFPERLACVAEHPTYTKSCGDAIEHLIHTKILPTAIVLLVSSALSFIGLVAGIVLIVSQKQKKEDFFDNPFSA